MQVILNSTKLVEIFINSDDFFQEVEKQMMAHCLPYSEGLRTKKKRQMSESEMMTIIIFYHYSGFKCFKWYYNLVIRGLFSSYFPTAFSYSRFIQLMHELNIYMAFFMVATRLSIPLEGNYVDSKKLVVCLNPRIKNHRVHKGVAQRGKSSTGWFFGFKLHLIINHFGEIVWFCFTRGNVADNNQDLLFSIADKLQGNLFADKGYISKVKADLEARGLRLISKFKKNMKSKVSLTREEFYYLSHRNLIETVFDILKHTFDIEHSRNRSTKNYFANILGAMIAYTFLDKVPSIPTYQKKITAAEYKKSKITII